MPFWVTLLIKLALQFGLPWLESHVPAAIAAIIEEILKLIKAHPQGQTGALIELKEQLKVMNEKCTTTACVSDLKRI